MFDGTSSALPDGLEFRADRHASVMLWGGGLILTLALVLAASFGGVGTGSLVSASILPIVMGYFRRSRFYLRFGADCLEVNLALLAGWHTVLYSEVTGCEVSEKLAVVYYRKHNEPADSKPNRIAIPLGELRTDDVSRCLDAFRTRLPSTVST